MFIASTALSVSMILKEREDVESKDADEKKTMVVSVGSKSEDDVEDGGTEAEKSAVVKTEVEDEKEVVKVRSDKLATRKRSAAAEGTLLLLYVFNLCAVIIFLFCECNVGAVYFPLYLKVVDDI